MGPDHYLSKLERNINVLDKAPAESREEILNHITWARELISRLEQLDYQERDKAIRKIHEILDQDYEIMGFTRKQ
jgi:transcription elongation GreA/GreB family factor